MLGQMLRAVNTAVLPSSASKGEHETGKSALDIATDMGIGQLIDAVQKGKNLAIVFQEADNGLVQTGKLLVSIVTTRVVSTATVEDIASSVSAFILWNALAVGEAEHSDHERPLAVILADRGLEFGSKTGQTGEFTEEFMEVWIGATALGQQFTQIGYGRGDAVQEMLLALEIASESVGTQYLQQAEEDTQL